MRCCSRSIPGEFLIHAGIFASTSVFFCGKRKQDRLLWLRKQSIQHVLQLSKEKVILTHECVGRWAEKKTIHVGGNMTMKSNSDATFLPHWWVGLYFWDTRLIFILSSQQSPASTPPYCSYYCITFFLCLFLLRYLSADFSTWLIRFWAVQLYELTVWIFSISSFSIPENLLLWP